MVIKPRGVATTFWAFLFLLKRLLRNLLLLSHHPRNGAGLPGILPSLPAPACPSPSLLSLTVRPPEARDPDTAPQGQFL